MRRLLALPSLGILLLLAGCSAGDDPARAFQLFVANVQERKLDAAWDLLSRPSQEQLAELVRLRAEASGGAIENDPKKVLFGNAELARPVEKVAVKSQEGDRAVLTVTHVGGGSQDGDQRHQQKQRVSDGAS